MTSSESTSQWDVEDTEENSISGDPPSVCNVLSSTIIKPVEGNDDSVVNRTLQQMVSHLEASSIAWSEHAIIPPSCTPITGEKEISRISYYKWKETFMASVESCAGMSDLRKYNLFKRSAGPQLNEVLEGLSFQDSGENNSFESIIKKLDGHFNSPENNLLALMQFRVSRQLPDEPNLEYLRRMMRNVKFCGFPPESREKELVNTIAINSRDTKIIKEALSTDCTYAKLVNVAKAIELTKMIQSANKHHDEKKQEKPVAILAVTDPNKSSTNLRQQEGRWMSSRNPSRAQGRFNSSQRYSNGSPSECSRCGGRNHSQFNCQHRQTECNKCHIIGHLARKCRSILPSKRSRSPSKELENREKKRATTEVNAVSLSNFKVNDSECDDE